MRLGLAWDEWDPPYTSSQNQLIRFYNDNVDFAKGLLDLPLTEEPGKSFAYNTVATITLGQAVENAVPMTLLDYSVNELLLPLGIVDLEFLSTPTGLPNTGSSLYFRTRDMAKFGQLALDSTLTWSNPEEWDWQIDGYAYQWWIGHYDFDGGKLETYVAWGFGGQWIVAIPALDLVVAINSHGYQGEDEATNQGHALIRRYVLEAISD
jgi:CubicO group peptidase (beta-lactamase class C family)